MHHPLYRSDEQEGLIKSTSALISLVSKISFLLELVSYDIYLLFSPICLETLNLKGFQIRTDLKSFIVFGLNKKLGLNFHLISNPVLSRRLVSSEIRRIWKDFRLNLNSFQFLPCSNGLDWRNQNELEINVKYVKIFPISCF